MNIKGKIIASGNFTSSLSGVPIDVSTKESDKFTIPRTKVTYEFTPNNIKIEKGDVLYIDDKKINVTFFKPGCIKGWR